MRESIGATWIFSICLTFIILFTAYLAISVNYAKAFRIKSYMVSKIEENEGYDASLANEVSTYLTAQGYSAYGTCPQYYTSTNSKVADKSWTLTSDGCLNRTTTGKCAACIYRVDVNSGNDNINCNKAYYRVVTFFKFDLPVVNTLTTFQVSGESKLIYDFQNCK